MRTAGCPRFDSEFPNCPKPSSSGDTMPGKGRIPLAFGSTPHGMAFGRPSPDGRHRLLIREPLTVLPAEDLLAVLAMVANSRVDPQNATALG